MKTVKKIISCLALVVIANAASAGRYDSEYTYAKVVDVQPIYETYQVPQNKRVCKNVHRDDDYNSSHRGNVGGAIIGGIIGGIIGNRFGSGHGREATTAAGVIAGATLGSKAKRHNNNQPRRHCYTQTEYYEEQRVSGYDVAYDYNGKTRHARMQSHPGDRVRIEVSVQVADY
ncbi:MAG: glycine zipper 2TM domain-containing protein [Alcanivoracaceae bacterium]|nr:glycine zipper 2TM domain-containing protein [Alcanivoracaceae bacterium]